MIIMARRKLIDIGANLTDFMYQGVYHNKNHHVNDLKNVLQRSIDAGLEKMIITGTSWDDSQIALNLSKTHPMLYSTAGVHPTRCLELENNTESQINALTNLCLENRDKIVAVGEFGLDYARLEFCPKDVQLKNFDLQFEIAEHTKLPLFLHCREAADDLVKILKKNRDKFKTGVVHSFDGTYDEAKSIIDLGLYIGLNGCSLRTEQNLEVVKKLPIEKLMIETDCPYCDIRPTHASFKYVKTKFESVKKEKWHPDKLVKGRNEPCTIVQVLEVIAQLKQVNEDELAETLFDNTENVFFAQ